MKLSVRRLLLLTLLCSVSFSVSAKLRSYNPEQVLWFTNPAVDWKTQALHLGNGYMGVSFYGGIETESFDIAEETFWTGGPNVTPNYNYGILPGGAEKMPMLKSLIAHGEIARADSLAKKHFMGDTRGYGYFSRVGRLYLDFAEDKGEVKDYVRGLDLSNSLGFVNYTRGNVGYSREYFCSYPDKLFVVHLSANQPEQVSFKVRAEWQYAAEPPICKHGNEWLIRGLIEPSGLKYCIRLRVHTDGGQLICTPDKLEVVGADEATLSYTVETEYVPVGPTYKGKNPEKITENTLNRTKKLTYAALKEHHLADYHQLYNRVNFHLAGDQKLSSLPTDQRVAELQKGMVDDSELKVLWFNLGRYSLISASRPGTLPSTLQGVWNNAEKAAWNGNFQSNINLQEMYWSCGPTNLPECQQAYIDWVKSLLPSGRMTAKAYYGTEGWVSHATGNVWGYTAPGTDLMWGLYSMGAAWHCRHLWEQYLYTGDKSYLKETAYPIMKEAALFYLQNLVKGPEGLYMSLGVTAEHGIEMLSKDEVAPYSTVSGESNKGKVYLAPCFQDIEMIYDLFSNVMAAHDVLGSDNDFVKQIESARSQLVPLKIGKYGQLQEWLVDADNPRDHHRHIAHLYALFPGNMITASHTPALYAAAKKSLDMRGDGVHKGRWPHSGGNWSAAWRMACRARLLDGEAAIRIFNQMIHDVGFENMMSNQSGNMQVDAMMATPALFTELLMQSHEDFIHILPALPAEWPEGEINGVVARGGYRISMKWQAGQLTNLVVEVPTGKVCPPLKLANKELLSTDSRVHILEATNRQHK